MKISWAIVLGLVALSTMQSNESIRADELRVGRPIPSVELLRMRAGNDGDRVTFSDAITEKTLVFVYASW